MLTQQDLILSVGNRDGHFTRKENRAAKLIARWAELREKFTKMVVAGRGKTETARHAYAVLLMMETGIRIGNEDSAEGFICENRRLASKDCPEKGVKEGDVIWQHPLYGQTVQTFGLTTLLHEHVEILDDRLELTFTGKKIVEQNLVVRDATLVAYAPIGLRSELFLGVTKYTLTRFIKCYVGRKFMPKDLRTACVNLKFIERFCATPHREAFNGASTKSGRNKALATAIEDTAGEIGHTKSVCRSSYLSSELLRLISASTAVLCGVTKVVGTVIDPEAAEAETSWKSSRET